MNRSEHDNSLEKNPTASAGMADRLRMVGGRLPLPTIAVFVLVVVGLALLAFSLAGGNHNPLYPPLPAFTPPSGTVDPQPREISFTQLNDDPASFQDQRLQVSGIYTPLSAPECLDYTGPVIRWSLVADELQLNATGYEDLLRLAEEGIEMTVTGTWRLYQGPLGCGKEPVDDIVWYLAVDRILLPNPVQGAVNPALTVVVGSREFPESAGATIDPSVGEGSPTLDSTDILSPTATLDSGLPVLPTPTPTNTLLPVTPLAPVGTPATPDPLATPDLTATSVMTGTVETTPGAEGTPSPAIPTTTPSGSGYPPGQTPESTATPENGYP